MKNFLLFLLFSAFLFSADPIFNTYIKPFASYNSLDLDYSVHMVKDGNFEDKPRKQMHYGRKGETHKFSYQDGYFCAGAAIGVQKGRFDNFYELGLSLSRNYSNDFYVRFGYTLNDFYTRRDWLPYISFGAGLGYKQSLKDLLPSNVFYFAGFGVLHEFSRKNKLDLYVKYQKSHWRTFFHDYGDEIWRDSILSFNAALAIFIF